MHGTTEKHTDMTGELPAYMWLTVAYVDFNNKTE